MMGGKTNNCVGSFLYLLYVKKVIEPKMKAAFVYI